MQNTKIETTWKLEQRLTNINFVLQSYAICSLCHAHMKDLLDIHRTNINMLSLDVFL